MMKRVVLVVVVASAPHHQVNKEFNSTQKPTKKLSNLQVKKAQLEVLTLVDNQTTVEEIRIRPNI